MKNNVNIKWHRWWHTVVTGGASLGRLIDGAKRRGARYVDPPRRLTKLIAEEFDSWHGGFFSHSYIVNMLTYVSTLYSGRMG